MRDMHPDMFQSWRNLKSLVCSLINDSMLYHLATSSKLMHLTIQVDEKNDYGSLVKLAGQPVFPALQGLDIAATHTFHCIPNLKIAELPLLLSLHIHSTEEGLTNVELHWCFRLRFEGPGIFYETVSLVHLEVRGGLALEVLHGRKHESKFLPTI